MKTRTASFLARGTLATLLSLSAAIALAHHSISAKFDDSKQVTLSGRITDVDWANPHVHVFINVPDGKGKEVNWAIELASTIELDFSGWNPDTVKIGETLTVSGATARNGSHQVWGSSVKNAAGKTVFTVKEDAFSARAAKGKGEVPRWPDKQPRLGPAPGATGYWAVPSATSLVEDGVKVAADANGLLKNINDAAKVAPFQDWARDLYKLRQSNNLKDDPSFLNCIPPTGPRQFQQQFGFQFVEQRERNRIFVLHAGGNGNWRLIYTDGRTGAGQVTGNDDNPLFFGHSSAKWEGDTMVVDNTGFNEGFWFSNGGLPHTKQLHLTERFTRTDLNTLHYEVTIDDPGAYTRPWKASWDMKWIADQELPEYYCQDNRQ